ncbi:hypothetical protein BS50DRAFT_586704 [Corynespora cassiicola Philippines]|uniref:Uncharacterized protein n=1 Tax=Corynespora cassiicola Philippines TaxID=1448308 RepID=A0A2T2NVD3_CORCC|nr:hypothetical protein BS50DRAFT_586704 [Corynespora cassiicola Philippines]
MAAPESSLLTLKFNDGNSTICALPECTETAVQIFCPKCSETPDIDMTSISDNIRYCSLEHLNQSSATHAETCRNRRWLRDMSRIGEIHHQIFIASAEETYDHVLLDYTDIELGVRRLIYQETTKPRSEQPFCAPDTDEATRLCALSLNACVHSITLGSGFLAYATKGTPSPSPPPSPNAPPTKTPDLPVRLREFRFFACPTVAVEVLFDDGTPAEAHEYYHTVVHAAPAFLPEQQLPSCEGGVVFDATCAQYGFEEPVDNWENYEEWKVNADTVSSEAFGRSARKHAALFAGPGAAKQEDLITEAVHRTVFNALFEELEPVGGMAGLLEMQEDAFRGVIGKMVKAVKRDLHGLSAQIDTIQYEDSKSEEQKNEDFARLVVSCDGKGCQVLASLLQGYTDWLMRGGC